MDIIPLTLAQCINRDIEGYLRNATHLDSVVAFPFLGTITHDFFEKIIQFCPGLVLDRIWPNYAPLATIKVNL